MMPHTPGKLRYDRNSMLIFEGNESDWTIAEIRGWSYLRSAAIGLSDDDATDSQDAIGERLVDCWNALDGLNPADVPRLLEERRELLAACKRALHLVEDEDNNPLIVQMAGSFGLLLDLQTAVRNAERGEASNAATN